MKTPWVLGEIEWSRERAVDAVTWLSDRLDKSILRLETKDYRDHHLSQLVARHGSAPPLNGEVFNELISKIRGRSKLPRDRRIAVFDYEVRRFLDLVDRAEAALDLDVRGLAAARERIEDFLDRRGPADVEVVLAVLEEARPEMVFAAGDLSDLHGTHRKCLRAVERALARYDGPAPEVWLYRGAWQEWPVSRASVLVPMSEEELEMNTRAVFKHESQKDRAPFPGPDEREFWERVRDRNRGSAETLDLPGLPAYFAIEAYLVRHEGETVTKPIVATSSLGDGDG